MELANFGIVESKIGQHHFDVYNIVCSLIDESELSKELISACFKINLVEYYGDQTLIENEYMIDQILIQLQNKLIESQNRFRPIKFFELVALDLANHLVLIKYTLQHKPILFYRYYSNNFEKILRHDCYDDNPMLLEIIYKAQLIRMKLYEGITSEQKTSWRKTL